MTRKHTRIMSSLAALALVFAAGILAGGGGPLNPPAGPVASTYKTLTEVEPRIAINATNTPGDADSTYKILLPGSYYLTANLVGSSGKMGIEIATNNVTIDLNGFRIQGVAGSLDGIGTTVLGLNDVTIRNGTCRSWGQSGIFLGFSSANCSVIEIHATGNGADGISGGYGTTIDRCIAYSNTGDGIFVNNASVISDSTAYSNASTGIIAGTGSAITGSIAHSNSGYGISANTSSSVTSCSAYGNDQHGLYLQTNCSVTGCASFGNNMNGIAAGPGSTITSSSADANSGDGISVNQGSTVTHCSSRANVDDGISASAGCLVLDNTCQNNGSSLGSGAGIYVSGGGSRVEGNNCSGADRGIEIAAAGNFIARNTCSSNTTNWVVPVGNYCLVILGAPTTTAINGDSGGLSPGSTNPNANFTY